MGRGNKLKILHVYKDYFPILGGIENHLRTLAEAQAEAGHDVTVLVTNPATLEPSERINGAQIVRARRLATVASTPLSVDIYFKLRSLKPDITHLHFPYPVGELAQLMAGSQRPYVLTYHSDIVRQQGLLRVYRPFLLHVLRKSQKVIATSERYVKSSRYLSLVSDKCTVIPLSVEPKFFEPAPPLVPKGDRLTLLFVGRHRYYKGVDDLLRALTAVDAKLLVAGDGPMRPAWTRLTGELALNERVQFLGHVADDALPALYASADVFVLPANSRAEAFGKVLLEAMAAGLPCITTELETGTSYVVKDGVTGLVVPPRDPRALAQAVSLFRDNMDLRRRMGTCGRERVQSHFSTQKMVTSVEEVYYDVLGQLR